MKTDHLNVVVTGGSRGLGAGIVEAFVAQGAKVTVVARDPAALDAIRSRLGVETISADVTDEAAAHRIVSEVRPDVLVLNAGTPPRMARLDQCSWADFTAPWDTDVKSGLYWMQAAMRQPLARGARILTVSSGAAVAGSPMSGGYGGAKRMLWFMTTYADKLSRQLDLGLRFQVVLPRQMVAGTGVGDAASFAYAKSLGIEPAEYLKRFGAPMWPRAFGDHVLSILHDPAHAKGLAFGVNGDAGVTVLE